MTFGAYERSTYSGQPVQLYEFLRSSGGVDYYWRYTTADRDLYYSEVAYTATAITDDGVRLSGEAAATEYKVTLPITEDFCTDFRAAGSPPSDSIYLRVRRAHVGDIDGLDTDIPVVKTAHVTWVGSVDGLTQTNDIEAQITCSMLATSFQRGGLRYSWMQNCPHMLYFGLTCKVDKDAFRTDTVVETIDGNKLTSVDFGLFDNGWYDGGYIEFTMYPRNFIERRMVKTHLGDTLTVMGSLIGLTAGTSVSAYAGCKRTVRACIDKFDNYDNYGGFPQIPGRNPFDGKAVF